MKKNIREKILAFYSAFNYCGSFILQLPDEDIELIAFEDYCWGNFMDKPIEELFELKVINEDIVKKVKRIRILSEHIFSPDNQIEFSAEYVKTSKEWKEIFNLADKIKSYLENSNRVRQALKEEEKIEQYVLEIYIIFNDFQDYNFKNLNNNNKINYNELEKKVKFLYKCEVISREVLINIKYIKKLNEKLLNFNAENLYATIETLKEYKEILAFTNKIIESLKKCDELELAKHKLNFNR